MNTNTSIRLEMSAIISECGKYRYSLTRRWDEGPVCLFVMLNPSTADATVDDPTIRKCVKFAKREGCGALEVVNLYAYRATDRKALKTLGYMEAVGDENDRHIREALGRCQVVVGAWGNNSPWAGRRLEVVDMIERGEQVPLCFKKTKSGNPYHPLYIPDNCPMQPYGHSGEAE